jgi:hypothetical protein
LSSPTLSGLTLRVLDVIRDDVGIEYIERRKLSAGMTVGGDGGNVCGEFWIRSPK